MNQTELFIYGYRIELDDGALVAMTYALNDIAVPNDVNSDFSFVFKVPKTAKNVIRMEWSDQTSSESDIPYRYAPAHIVQNGVTVLPLALAINQGSDEKSYKVKIISGNGSFFKLIKSKQLPELDFSAFDHTFDYNVRGTFGNTYASVYKYPFVNYGRFPTYRTVDVRYLRPAVFVLPILEKIAAEIGYTVSGDILNSREIKKMFLPFTNELFTGDPKYTKAKGVTTSDFQVPYGGIHYQFLKINDSTGALDPYNLITDATPKGYYTAPYDGKFLVRFTIDYENFSGSSGWVEAWIDHLGGQVIMDATDLDYENWLLGITTGVLVWETTIEMQSGDKLYLKIGNGGIDFIDIHSGSSMEVYDAVDLIVTYGDIVSLQRTLPPISQIDFFKAIAQIFGIIFFTDSLNQVIYLRQFKELYQNTHKAKDWTSKVDISKAKRKTSADGYGQINYYRYKEDKDDKLFLRQSADSSFNISDETLPASKVIFQLPFAATHEDSRTLEGIPVPYIIKQEPPGLPDDDSFQIGTEPRILYDLTIDPADLTGNPIYLTDGTTTLAIGIGYKIPFCYFQKQHYFVYAGAVFNDVLTWKNFLVRWYPDLQIMLNRAKFLEVPANITPVDIETRDHLIPIYLKQESANFFLEKIDRHINDGRLTNIFLTRM